MYLYFHLHAILSIKWASERSDRLAVSQCLVNIVSHTFTHFKLFGEQQRLLEAHGLPEIARDPDHPGPLFPSWDIGRSSYEYQPLNKAAARHSHEAWDEPPAGAPGLQSFDLKLTPKPS